MDKDEEGTRIFASPDGVPINPFFLWRVRFSYSFHYNADPSGAYQENTAFVLTTEDTLDAVRRSIQMGLSSQERFGQVLRAVYLGKTNGQGAPFSTR